MKLCSHVLLELITRSLRIRDILIHECLNRTDVCVRLVHLVNVLFLSIIWNIQVFDGLLEIILNLGLFFINLFRCVLEVLKRPTGIKVCDILLHIGIREVCHVLKMLIQHFTVLLTLAIRHARLNSVE